MHDQFIDDLPNVSVLPKQRRPRSFLAMLPMIVIGGGMGLLAGYGALSLMGTKGIGPLKTVPHESIVVHEPPVVHQRPPRILQPERPARIEPIETAASPVINPEPLPVEAEPVFESAPKPRPSQVIRLNLEKPVQRENVTLSGAIKIVRIEGCGYTLSPATGKLPLEATLEGPRPIVLNVAFEKGLLAIETTVKNDAGKSVPFTTRYLDLLLRRVMKTGTNAANQLASLKKEQASLKAKLDAHVPMAYLEHKRATARLKELDASILHAEAGVRTLETEARATQDLAAFAHKVNEKCTIVAEALAE